VPSETLTRGTGCLNWARPGLWGLLVGDCQVLPGEMRNNPDSNSPADFNRYYNDLNAPGFREYVGILFLKILF
jgi:hypothetical protein